MPITHSPSVTAGVVAPLLLQALAQHWWKFLVRGAAAIGFGVMAFMMPGATVFALTLLWGAYALVDGVVALWAAITGGSTRPRWWLAIVGVAGTAAGVFTFFWPGATALTLLMLVAAWAVLTGVMQIIGAIRLRKEIEGEWMLALSGILSLAFGVFMLSQPAAGAVTAVWLLALLAMAIGVTYIAFGFRLRRHKAA